MADLNYKQTQKFSKNNERTPLTALGRMSRRLYRLLYLFIFFLQCHMLFRQTFLLNISSFFSNLSLIQEDCRLLKIDRVVKKY